VAAGEPDRDILDTPQAGPAAIRGSALRTGGYVTGVLLSALSAPLLIRHLGIGDFGRYVTVLSLIAIVGGLADAGLTAVGVREYAVRAPDARRRLVQNLLGLRLVLTTIAVGGAVAFSALAGYGSELVLGTLLAGIGLIVQVSQNTLSIPLQTDLRLGWVTAAELLKQVLGVALIVAGVLVGAGVVEFLAVPIPAGLAALVLVAVLVRTSVSLRPAFHRADWSALLRDSVVFAAATAISVAYLRITVVLMSLIATELQTGYFATSFRVLEVLMGVPAILISTLFPVLARAGRDDLKRLGAAVQRILDVALILGFGAGLAICLAATPLVLVLGGDAAEPAAPVLRLQAPGIVATFVATTCQFALLSMRLHKTILLANVVAITTSVALTFALVPLWDARGAAVATTAAEWLLALTAFIALRSALPEAGIGFGVAPKVVLAAGLGLLPLLVLPAIAATVVGLAIFAVVLLALRAIPPELAVLVRRPA
jgi:O-antigen/teichoic acid export membrane protein